MVWSSNSKTVPLLCATGPPAPFTQPVCRHDEVKENSVRGIVHQHGPDAAVTMVVVHSNSQLDVCHIAFATTLAIFQPLDGSAAGEVSDLCS